MHRPAAWFSRHLPTDAQLAEIEALGFELTPLAIQAGVKLGSINLNDDEGVFSVVQGLTAVESLPFAIFGVFPTPILEQLHLAATRYRSQKWSHTPDYAVPCFASWNVQRAKEGEKPTFVHSRFCCIGYLDRYLTPPSVLQE